MVLYQTFQASRSSEPSKAQERSRPTSMSSNTSHAVSMGMSSMTGSGMWFTRLRHIAGSNVAKTEEFMEGVAGLGRLLAVTSARLQETMRDRH
jgi:hypothetical protein